MHQSETSHKFWDTTIKAGTALAISISVILASCQFKEKVEKEYMKPIWNKQIEAYGKVTQIASLAATTENTEEQLKLLAQLQQLYISELIVVGDARVTLPTVYFMESLERCTLLNDCTSDMLTPFASSISRCVRKSLGKSWNRDFHDLSEEGSSKITADSMCK